MDGKKVYKSMYEWLNMWAEQYGSHEALCDNKGSYSYESLNTLSLIHIQMCIRDRFHITARLIEGLDNEEMQSFLKDEYRTCLLYTSRCV